MRLLSKGPFNRKAFRDMTEFLWDVSGGFEIYEIEQGIFLFTFEIETERERILSMEPWTFDKSLLVLKVYEGDRDNIGRLNFHFATFWVQIHSLPLDGRNSRTAEAVGNTIGIFKEAERKNSGRSIGKLLRVRVALDITKALRRGTRVRLGDNGPIVGGSSP